MAAENSLSPARLCHLKKTYPEQEYGFNLHGEKGKKGQYIGSVDAGSPADLAGLKAGDKILSVNGRSISQDDHKQVVSKIRENPVECKMLVLSEEDTVSRKTSGKSTPTSPVSAVDISKLSLTPSNTLSIDLGVPKLATEQNGQAIIEKPQQINKSDYRLKPRLCVLTKATSSDEFGFNLHAENGRTYYIGKVDGKSIAEIAGLSEGQRIVGVNKVLIDSTKTHKELVNLIKQDPSSVSILVATLEVDDYYAANSLSFNFDDVEAVSDKKNHVTSQPIANGSTTQLQNGAYENISQNSVSPQTVTHFLNNLQLTKDFTREKNGGNNIPIANGQAHLPVGENGGEITKRKHISASSSVSSSSFENPGDRERSHDHRQINNISSTNGPNSNEGAYYQPVQKQSNGSVSSSSKASIGDDLLPPTLTASEMRERLRQKRKRDPRHDQNLSMQEKFEIINKL